MIRRSLGNVFSLVNPVRGALFGRNRIKAPWRIDAKDYLNEKGYRFQEIDVGRDREAYEQMKQLSSQTYVPTFVAGDKVLANFDTNQLEKFLNEHQINPGQANS